MAGPAKLYSVWNFFEKIHTAPAEFVSMWTNTTNYVQQNKEFIVTQLHRNLNQEGANKYVNFAVLDGLSLELFQDGKKTSETWTKLMKAANTVSVARPGGYEEIGTNTGKPLAPWLPKDDKSIFIISGFKASDEKDSKLQEAFEKDWMESSGANFILKNAPKELGISHCGLYKKFTPRPGMLYVLRVELAGVGEGSVAAKTFLSQLKAFKYPDYFERVDTDLYWPDPKNIYFNEVGKKGLPQGYTYKP